MVLLDIAQIGNWPTILRYKRILISQIKYVKNDQRVAGRRHTYFISLAGTVVLW